MAPSQRAIVDGIYAAINTLHTEDPETLTVRNVRTKTEADLGLETGLLSNESWKDKSKKIIKDYASELADAAEAPEVPTPKPKVVEKAAPPPKKATAPVKNSRKRAAPEPKARVPKRQKKEDTPSEAETSELTEVTPTDGGEESEASDFGDSEDSDAPKKKKGSKAKGKAMAPAKRQSKSKAEAASDSEDISNEESEEESSIGDSDDTDAPKKKTKAKPKAKTPVKRQSGSKAKIADSDESAEEVDSDVSAPKKKATPKKATPKKAIPTKSAKAIVDSDAESEGDKPAPKPVSTPKKGTPKKFEKSAETANSDTEDLEKPASKRDAGSDSDMSIVLDPTPKPKRQRAPKGEKKAKEPKAPKAKAASKAKSTADLSPEEVQIKTLQSQLGKCGIKKIWAFELKQYGDDNKAKIRHLQNALNDIGMVGRYSDARAREIKEQRELMADLEAVQEGEKAWGLESGRRSRGAATKKSLKEISEDEDEESGEEGAQKKKAKRTSRSASKDSGSNIDDQPPTRKRRVDPGLAFLGSEEDSDE